MRSYFLVTVFISLHLAIFAAEENRNHKKRQIYREQVLPHAGGRIPETAFETDRLFLNHLQREGIAIPDGVVLDQRRPTVYQYYNKPSRVVFSIALSSDGRYIPKEGKYLHEELPTVETTYLYPQIHGHKVTYTPKSPAYPVYRTFELHNPQLNPVKLQPKNKAKYLNISPNTNKKTPSNSYKTESYQNVHILNLPLSSPTPTITNSAAGEHINYPPNYGNEQLFNNFDNLFNNFNLHQTGNSF